MYRLRKDIELSYAIFYILLIMPVVAFMLLIPAMIWPPIAILSMLILVGDAVFVILFFAYTFIAYVIDTFFEKV